MECLTGGCKHTAVMLITFIDGWKGRFCKCCAAKIGGEQASL